MPPDGLSEAVGTISGKKLKGLLREVASKYPPALHDYVAAVQSRSVVAEERSLRSSKRLWGTCI